MGYPLWDALQSANLQLTGKLTSPPTTLTYQPIDPSISMRRLLLAILSITPMLTAFQQSFQPCLHKHAYTRLLAASKKKKTSSSLRADRVVSNRSGMSRSESSKLLQERRIWQKGPNGEFIALAGPSVKINTSTNLWIDQTHLIPPPPPLLAVYHKPKWVLSVRKDPHQRPCVDSILPDLHPVGRLDYDSQGLLLFSSSGALTQYLLHPKHAITKEYVATVVGVVQEDVLKQQLQQGVTTGEGVHTAELIEVTSVPNVPEYLQHVQQQQQDDIR